MITAEKTTITVKAEVNAPVEKVWTYWTDPAHIMQWNNASEDWYTPKAEIDLRVGGKFSYRMEARDGSDGFDFDGEFDSVVLLKQIKYTLSDGRNVQVNFLSDGTKTVITEIIETEVTNPLDMQLKGWQAILDNFKKYTEQSGKTEMLHFEILINTSPEKVYDTMIDEKGYSEWTAAFDPTSHFKGTWEKDSKILFLADAPDGNIRGMVSRIRENIRNQFISIEHLGVVDQGKEVLCGPEANEWAGMQENYSFTPKDGQTLLSVDTDTSSGYKSYFMSTWPRALEILKSICER